MYEIEQETAGVEDIVELSAVIVGAYVSNNPLSASELPKLIGDVYGALAGARSGVVLKPLVELKPTVPIRKSITPDYVICLEDGKKFKSLKRHLRTAYGMSPEQYRRKWGLAPDYPMVAPNYSAARSKLATANGLGRKPASRPAPRRKRAPDAA